ncbi:DUF3126 family protein [Kiloniella sp. b19]|uniref:DUF3126 family protein n=1 Tax=Kiloniella sp. GXU_MW_B19 TaxID=3141326 RepID=UPI0031DEA327
MKPDEITRVEKYLQDAFSNQGIALDRSTRKADSIEVTLAGEFIGVVYRDEEEGDLSFSFNMAILSEDLPPA